MLRSVAILALFALAACANSGHALPETSANDPVWQLNPGKWTLGVNDLRVPPDAPRGPAVAQATVVQQ